MGTQVADDVEVSVPVFKGIVKTVKYCMYMIRTQVGGMVQNNHTGTVPMPHS